MHVISRRNLQNFAIFTSSLPYNNKGGGRRPGYSGLAHVVVDANAEGEPRVRRASPQRVLEGHLHVLAGAGPGNAQPPLETGVARYAMSRLQHKQVRGGAWDHQAKGKALLTSSRVLRNTLSERASSCMRRTVGDASGPRVASTSARQYEPPTCTHWSKSPNWFTLPFSSPDGSFPLASCTADKPQIHYFSDNLSLERYNDITLQNQPYYSPHQYSLHSIS